MNYEENVRAILQCCFSQSKDELIETAVKAIVALKQEPIVINPTSPIVAPQPLEVPAPYYPITTTPSVVCKDPDALGAIINGNK